ncbi:MAG TPA: DUF1294 domain-containing protein [Planctomycetota bacterium]|nr:DUF1294 domain-containing protein [Planctomycetota bacterium]
MVPWIAFGALNAATLVLYAYDKAASRRSWRRVPERTLHLLALAGGSPAAFVGQQLFRHKTAKPRFQAVFWIIVITQLAALGLWYSRR